MKIGAPLGFNKETKDAVLSIAEWKWIDFLKELTEHHCFYFMDGCNNVLKSNLSIKQELQLELYFFSNQKQKFPKTITQGIYDHQRSPLKPNMQTTPNSIIYVIIWNLDHWDKQTFNLNLQSKRGLWESIM